MVASSHMTISIFISHKSRLDDGDIGSNTGRISHTKEEGRHQSLISESQKTLGEWLPLYKLYVAIRWNPFFLWKLETTCLGAKMNRSKNKDAKRIRRDWHMDRNSYDSLSKKSEDVSSHWLVSELWNSLGGKRSEDLTIMGVGVSHKPAYSSGRGIDA